MYDSRFCGKNTDMSTSAIDRYLNDDLLTNVIASSTAGELDFVNFSRRLIKLKHVNQRFSRLVDGDKKTFYLKVFLLRLVAAIFQQHKQVTPRCLQLIKQEVEDCNDMSILLRNVVLLSLYKNAELIKNVRRYHELWAWWKTAETKIAMDSLLQFIITSDHDAIWMKKFSEAECNCLNMLNWLVQHRDITHNSLLLMYFQRVVMTGGSSRNFHEQKRKILRSSSERREHRTKGCVFSLQSSIHKVSKQQINPLWFAGETQNQREEYDILLRCCGEIPGLAMDTLLPKHEYANQLTVARLFKHCIALEGHIEFIQSTIVPALQLHKAIKARFNQIPRYHYFPVTVSGNVEIYNRAVIMAMVFSAFAHVKNTNKTAVMIKLVTDFEYSLMQSEKCFRSKPMTQLQQLYVSNSFDLTQNNCSKFEYIEQSSNAG